jgi:hypothetical protein
VKPFRPGGLGSKPIKLGPAWLLPVRFQTLAELSGSSKIDPKPPFKRSALDRLFRLDDHALRAELVRHHGHRRLAAEPWPRTV